MKAIIPALGVVALTLGGCALANHPEYQGLKPIGSAEASKDSITAQLDQAKAMGDTYLTQGKQLENEATAAGAGLFAFGLYGAGVAAFNPAPKNLLAALLGAGTFQAYRSGLKPSERAKVYVAGYRAMDCVWASGRPLSAPGEASASAAVAKEQLRRLDRTFQDIARARIALAAPGAGADAPALLARLDAVEKNLNELEPALVVEAQVMNQAPYRISAVRRQIETTVEQKLAGVAPDYGAALQILRDSSKLPTGGGAAPQDGGAAVAPPPPPPPPPAAAPTPAQLVARVEADAASIKRNTPILAATSYAALGHCVEVVG